MDYQITCLTDELVLIRWFHTPLPNSSCEDTYLAELGKLLDESPVPLYFISDLRKGRIANIRALRRLGRLTEHKNWAGSTAFSKDPITSILVRSFKTFAVSGTSRNEMQTTPEQALGFIESLKSGLTEGLDWAKILNEA